MRPLLPQHRLNPTHEVRISCQLRPHIVIARIPSLKLEGLVSSVVCANLIGTKSDASRLLGNHFNQ